MKVQNINISFVRGNKVGRILGNILQYNATFVDHSVFPFVGRHAY